jgi:hypothetical protein
MGRYAQFNTGFEYKFVFGIQASQDIEQFGGCAVYDTFDDATIEWSPDDREEIEGTLHHMETMHGYSRPDLTQYEKSVEGTYKLSRDIKYTANTKQPYYAYVLGLLIYHQLSYREYLSAAYEL